MTEINSSALEKDQGFYITAHDVFQAVGNQSLLSSIFTETCLKLVHSKVDQDTDLIWFDLIWFDLIWFHPPDNLHYKSSQTFVHLKKKKN